MREIYAEAAKHNVITIGGMDPNVGFGGYLTGGGHSPISGKYGLAVDQVLEMEVVTPSGEIVTANECQNSDLFWAMRGGGGSTFGVLLTATVKTVPMPNITRFILNYNATQEEADNNNNDNFYRATAYFHTQLKALSQVPYMGYYYVLPLSEAGAAASSSNLTPRSLAPRSSTSKSGPMLFVWTGWGIDVSVEDTYKAFAPTVAKLDSTEGVNSVFVAFPGGDFYSYWASSISDGGVGVNAQLTSRLWDEAALSDEELLYQTLHKLDDQMLQGLAVSGPGVRSIAPDFSSVTPAWRKSYAHMIVPKSYPMRDPAAKAATEKTLTYDIGKTLRDQGGSGCYLNEADVNEPDYEHAFWGSNYKRLAKIKRKLDPKGVFWCKACVGGKEWKEAADGTVCRA